MFQRYSTQGPQGILQALGQGHETLPAQHHAGIRPARERQAEVVEPMIERNASDAHPKPRGIGEIRQALLTRRMFLAKDHLPLGTMQRLPEADPALQRATQIIGEPGVAALHLAQHGDRPQSWAGLEHRYDLAVPVLCQWIGTPTPTRCSLLRGHSRIGIEPPACTGAEASFGCSGLAAMGSTEIHVQLRLLIGDVSAGHGGGLFREVEKPRHSGTRHGVAGRFPSQGTAPTPGSAYGRANARPPADPGAIQIDARSILFVAAQTTLRTIPTSLR